MKQYLDNKAGYPAKGHVTESIYQLYGGGFVMREGGWGGVIQKFVINEK